MKKVIADTLIKEDRSGVFTQYITLLDMSGELLNQTENSGLFSPKEGLYSSIVSFAKEVTKDNQLKAENIIFITHTV